MRKTKKILVCLLTAVMMLAALPAGVSAADGNSTTAGDFKITGGVDNTDFSYDNTSGVLTVNDGANLTISMADGATTPTSDRIVIAQSATATITLDEVSITAPQEKSAIEILSGSTLTLILSTGSESSLVGRKLGQQ